MTQGGSGICFQLSSSDPSVDVTGDPSELLSKFHRCLCKKTGEGQVTICYLNDEDSNYYHDGTEANLTGSEGDVMVYFPDIWYKGYESSDEYYISDTEVDGYHKANRSLLSAYMATATKEDRYDPGRLNSYSGKEAWRSISDGPAYDHYIRRACEDNGIGYFPTLYIQHCIIGWMFMLKYKTRDYPNIIGVSTKESVAGSTNSLGMTDTTPENVDSYKVNSFLGLEQVAGIFGTKNAQSSIYSEFIGDIDIRFNDDNKSEIHQIDINDEESTIRIITTMLGYQEELIGTVSSMIMGDYIDIFPKYTIHNSWTDPDVNNSNWRVADIDFLGYGFVSTSVLVNRGIGVFGLSGSVGDARFLTSRLSFSGDIIIEDDPQVFKGIKDLRQ